MKKYGKFPIFQTGAACTERRLNLASILAYIRHSVSLGGHLSARQWNCRTTYFAIICFWRQIMHSIPVSTLCVGLTHFMTTTPLIYSKCYDNPQVFLWVNLETMCFTSIGTNWSIRSKRYYHQSIVTIDGQRIGVTRSDHDHPVADNSRFSVKVFFTDISSSGHPIWMWPRPLSSVTNGQQIILTIVALNMSS